MESFSFELRLVDAVSASGKRMAAAVEGIKKSAEKTQHALNWHKEIEKTEQALHKITKDPLGLKKHIELQRELLEQRKKINKAIGRETFGEAFGSKLNVGKMFSAAAIGDLFAEGLIEGIKAPLEFFADGIKDVFKTVAHEQKFRLGEKFTLGGDKEASEFRERAESIGKESSFVPSQIRQLMLPLRANGFKQDAAEQAFGTAADLAAIHGKAGDMDFASTIIDAIDKLKVKGGGSAKQLVSILEGTGDSLQGFYEQIRKAKGLGSIKEAEKLLKGGGKVDMQVVLNALTTDVNKRQGGGAGTTDKEGGKGLESRWEHLKNLPEQFMEKLADSPALEKFSNAIERVIKKLDPDSAEGKKIFASLSGAFDKLGDLVEKNFTSENIDKFVAAVKKIPEWLDKAYAVGKLFAELWAGSKILNGIDNVTGALKKLSAASATGGSMGGGDKAQAAIASFGVGAAIGTFLDDQFGLSDQISMLGRGDEDAKDAAFNAKYSADGVPIMNMAPSQLVAKGAESKAVTTNNNVGGVVINFHGAVDAADAQSAVEKGVQSALSAQSHQATQSSQEHAASGG